MSLILLTKRRFRPVFTWSLLWLLVLPVLCLQPLVARDRNGIVRVGQQVPDFDIEMADGTVVTPQSLRGTVSVVVFFSTTCYDCRKELPVIERISHEFPDVRFVCISRAEDKASVQKFWHEHHLTLPYSAQSDKAVYLRFATRTIPRIYVVDEAGIVAATFVEKTSSRKLRRAISKTISKGV